MSGFSDVIQPDPSFLALFQEQIDSSIATALAGFEGGGGSVEAIQTIDVAVAQATLDFTAIPDTYQDLKLVLNGRATNAATISGVRLKVNNDGGNNYDDENSYAQDGTAGRGANVAYGAAHCGYITAATAPAGLSGLVILEIPSYARTHFIKSWREFNVYKTANAAELTISDWAGWWRSTAAINRLTLLLDAGNFEVGTIATLFGISGAS